MSTFAKDGESWMTSNSLTNLLPGAIKIRFHWPSAALLASYLLAFSEAYLNLSTGTGALVLFGAVQLTMLMRAWWTNEPMKRSSWTGIVLAVFGLIILLLPGSQFPDLYGFLMMLLAGVSWGGYTLLGQTSDEPLSATAGNFVLATPLVLGVWASTLKSGDMHVTTIGWTLASLSGVVASALGYVVWFAAVRALSSLQASVVQLIVPVIASLGGVLILSEALTVRFVFAAIATLGGILIVLMFRSE